MNIHIVFLIAGLNMMAYRASKVLLSLFAIELGVAQFFIGIMIAMYGVFQLVFALYAGKLPFRRADLMTGHEMQSEARR